MGASRTLLTSALALALLAGGAASPPREKSDCDASYALYLAGRGDLSQAVAHYRACIARGEEHDFSLVRHLALQIMEQGLSSTKPEDQIMALYGAALGQHPSLLSILQRGIASPSPQVQLLSLQLLAAQRDDAALDILNRAVNSSFILTRLEAIFQLARKRHPAAWGQIEAIMVRLPPEVEPAFPPLLAMLNDPHADTRLRQMLSKGSSKVRCAAIAAVAGARRDDFLRSLRPLVSQLDLPQQEAAATALGELGDTQSSSRLERLKTSCDSSVRVAAHLALYRLGRLGERAGLEREARKGNSYAIAALGEVDGSEPMLARLLSSRDEEIRFNAGVALLQRRDRRCLPLLLELLTPDERDVALLPRHSVGGSLTCFKPLPSAKQQFTKDPVKGELSRQVREGLLLEALHLPEESFLSLAEQIMLHRQNDLLPLLVSLLENLRTERAIALLKQGQQQPGAPLVRDYCTLALFRLGEEGPWEHNLLEWVERQRHLDLIQLRPVLPWEQRKEVSTDEPFGITAEEGSRLLVESLEALAQHQSSRAIDAILQTIEQGNAHNRYALAGLLVLATQ